MTVLRSVFPAGVTANSSARDDGMPRRSLPSCGIGVETHKSHPLLSRVTGIPNTIWPTLSQIIPTPVYL